MISHDNIPRIFSEYRSAFQSVMCSARQAEEMIEEISPIIESHTAMVCPACTAVCCINRHSHFDRSDVIFMSSLGREIPGEDPAATGTDSCRFLGMRGCVRKRSERPYRCTWFFCAPLLERVMEQKSNAESRKFMKMLQQITQIRTKMISDFETLYMKHFP